MKTSTIKNRVSYYFRFTLLFLITALIIYAPFILTQKSFVWAHDSYTQHLKAMIYISRWYRQTLKSLVKFDFKAISTYSFSIGYGSDAMSTLAYYGVGDPFYLLSALVPAKYIYLFYCLLIPVKNYCSGLAMSALCRFRWPSPEHDKGCLAGSLIYTFCGFALITCFGQPIFLSAMIIFPLVLLGIEKIRDGKRPWAFIISIFLATVSNFYFIVSIVVMAVMYACFRYFPIARGQFKRRFAEIGVMFAAGTVGVAMGGAILLPMVITVLGNKRVALKPAINLFYEARSCRMLPLDFLACNEVQYGALCYAGTALLCVFLLFSAKGFIKLRLQFLLYSALLFIPAFGYLTNGFSYPINRWCWAYSALVAMLVAELWPLLFVLTRTQKKVMAVGFTLYFAVCFFLSYELEINFLMPVIFTGFTLFHLFLAQRSEFAAEGAGGLEDPEADARRRAKRVRRAERGILLLTIAGICINGICENDPRFSDRIENYKELDCLAPFRTGLGASPANDRNMWLNDTSQISSTIGFDGLSFIRVSNTEPGFWYQNTSMLSGLSSTQSFWSVNSPYVLEYLDSLAVSDVNNNAWQFTNLDNRAILNELASVSYLYCMHPEKLPTGYSDESLDQNTANSVYQNLSPLPLGYTYDRTISREQFDTLTPAQRQEVLLTHAVTDQPGGLQDSRSIEEIAAGLDCSNVPFKSECLHSSVVQTDNRTFVVTEEGSQVKLTFDPITSGECYLLMKNIGYRETNLLDLYSDDKSCDPADQFTPEMFSALTPYERYKIRVMVYNSRPASNVKISADFMSGENVLTSNEVNYILPGDEQFYSGRQDFLLNSYTVRKGIDSIVVTFPRAGVYHFDEFSVISEPLTGYQDKIAKLGAESLENVNISQNKSSYVSSGVTGEITVSDNKLLCLTVPYSTGWKAYVDGTPAVIENVNLMFSGLWLTPGRHTIELRYETPGLLYGLCLSAAGLLLFLFWVIMTRRSKKREPQAEFEESLESEESFESAAPVDEIPAEEPAEVPSADIPAGEETAENPDKKPLV